VKLKVEGNELSEELIVRKDPNSSGTEADIEAQMTLLYGIRDNINAAAETINQIEWIRVQIERLDALLENDESAESILSAGKELDEKLIAVEENLFQMKLTGRGQDMARWPAQLISKIGALAGKVGTADFPPTTQQAARHGDYTREAAAHQGRLNELITQDLAALNGQLEEKNLPIIYVVLGADRRSTY
jgi:hypothetical protein